MISSFETIDIEKDEIYYEGVGRDATDHIKVSRPQTSKHLCLHGGRYTLLCFKMPSNRTFLVKLSKEYVFLF